MWEVDIRLAERVGKVTEGHKLVVSLRKRIDDIRLRADYSGIGIDIYLTSNKHHMAGVTVHQKTISRQVHRFWPSSGIPNSIENTFHGFDNVRAK